ncbi:MAG: PAS domain S-box protein [Candidatus Omnitrophica bacterium]|nr:PAS domain S-box protein [Candidatus Omnitrophota bacterium]
MRVSAENEIIGLNISEHRSKNEIFDLLTMMKEQAKSKDLSMRSEVSPFTEVGQIAQHYNIVLDSLQEALGRTEAIVQTAKDAIVTFSAESFQISSVNPSTESTFGFQASEMMGQPMDVLFEAGRSELKRIIDNDKNEKDPDPQLKVICKRKDGTLIPMEITLVEAKLNGKIFYTATFHDISQRGIFTQQLEIQTHELRHLNANLQEQKTIIELIGNVATIANEVASIEEMMSKIMAFVGDYFDWPIGHVYLRDRDNKQDFLSTDIWYVSGPVNLNPYQNAMKDRIERVSSSSLIGKCISQAASQWTQQIPDELKIVGEVTICGHFAFPVLVDSEVVAVVEFFAKEATGMTQSVQDVMPNLVAQLGRIFERRAVLSKLSESEQVFRSICSLAHDPIVMMDDRGKISFWNQSAEQLFGYVSVEAIGKELHELLAPARYHSQIYKALPHFWKTGQGEIISKPRQIMAKKKNGEEFLVEIAISAVSIRGKWHAIGIARALTSRSM